MAIVCGTDLSERTWPSVEVAALLARKLGVPLHLVLAMAARPTPRGGVQIADEPSARVQLERCRELGASGQLHITPGALSDSLVHIAARVQAELIVLAVPESPSSTWCAEMTCRVLERALVPVLFTRDAAPFRGWATGRRRLRAALDMDFGFASLKAAGWLECISVHGPVDLLAVHLYESLQGASASARTALAGDSGVSDVTLTLEREIRAHLEGLEGDIELTTAIQPSRGRHALQLSDCMLRSGADLLVIGCAVMTGIVDSKGTELFSALRDTHASVVCVPTCPLPQDLH